MNNNLFSSTCKTFTSLLTDDEVDSIFNFHNKLCNNSALGIRSDEEMPDVRRFYFSTMGNDIVALGRNNIPICIRSKPSLNNYLLYNDVLSTIDKKQENSKIHTGIYIIDYITYYRDVRTPFDNMIKYFLSIPKNIDAKLARKIASEINAKSMHGRFSLAQFTIKLIYFVSSEDIIKNGYIYSPDLDVCLCKNVVNGETLHPFSNNNSAPGELIKHQTNVNPDVNQIVIEIIDNNKSEAYYINIGDKVHKLYSSKNINKHNNIKFTLQKNGTVYEDKYVELINHKDIGLYKTEEEADVAGSIEKKAELERSKYENKKLELELEKLNTDKLKLDHTVEVLKLELTQLKEKHTMDMTKKHLDFNQSVYKSTLEMGYYKIKEEIGLKSLIVKNINDQRSLMLKEESEKLSMTNKKLDNGVKTLSIISSILKLIF